MFQKRTHAVSRDDHADFLSIFQECPYHFHVFLRIDQPDRFLFFKIFFTVLFPKFFHSFMLCWFLLVAYQINVVGQCPQIESYDFNPMRKISNL